MTISPTRRRLRLGVDIGGTKTAVVLVTNRGDVLAQAEAPSGRGPMGVVSVAAGLARTVLAQAPVGADIAIGACMPGLVDRATGVVRFAVNLDVETLDLAADLGAALERPVVVENDVKAAALGAFRLRGSQVDETLGYLNLGTGLAAAVVHRGELLRGVAGAAGEIGHLPVGGTVPCGCGQVGCLETVASGSALARLWPDGAGGARDVFAAAQAGDLAAQAAAGSLSHGVGLAIHLLALTAGADVVLIGGGLTGLGDPFAQAIRADLQARASTSRLLAGLDLDRRFEFLEAVVPVAALGAALLPDRIFGPAATEGSRPVATVR